MLIQPPQCLAPSLQIIRSIDKIYERGLPAPVESVVVPSEFAVVVVAVDIPVVAVVVPVVVACVVDEHGEEVHEDDGEGDEQSPKVRGDGEGEVELLSHLHFPLELRPRSGSKMLQNDVNKVVDVKMWFWNTRNPNPMNNRILYLLDHVCEQISNHLIKLVSSP